MCWPRTNRGQLQYDEIADRYLAHFDLLQSEYTFSDGLTYKNMDWNYCSLEDRRFHSERCKEILPAGKTHSLH